MRARIALALLALPVSALTAGAQERVGVRTGDHPSHGRIVFDWAEPPRYTVEREGDRVTLRFPEPDRIELSGARRLPRNIVAVRRVEGGVELTLRPGAGLRHFRNGPKVALDALDPPDAAEPAARSQPAAQAGPRPQAAPPSAPAEAAPARVARPARATAEGPPAARPNPDPPPLRIADRREGPPPDAAGPAPARPETPRPEPARPEAARPEAVRPEPARSEAVRPEAARPEPARAEAPAARAPAVSREGPAPVAAPVVPPPALRFRLEAEAAAAALRRGDALLLAFDTERVSELDPRRLPPAYGAATLHRVPGAAVLALPLPASMPVSLAREGADWVVRPGVAGEGGRIAPAAAGPFAELPAAEPRRVVVLPDPLTGLPLLLGTVASVGQAQGPARAFPAFELPETLLGAAVLARSDRVHLRGAVGRFLVAVEGGVAMAQDVATALPAAAGLSRTLDLPARPVPELLERLRGQQAAIAAAPPLQRAAPRLAAAETLLALGLPQEAQSMLRLAAQETAEASGDARHRLAAGAAALLAGRVGEADTLAAGPATDEALLWQGLHDAAQGRPRRAAPALAGTLPLLLSYPDGLRRRLLPLAAEALAEGGEVQAAARAIEAEAGDPRLGLAAALIAEARGDADRALEAYAAVAQGRDRRQRARALRREAELRLATGRLDAAGAARGLERALAAWRDDEELPLRRRIAELRLAGGDARGALAALRDAEAALPDQAATLRPAMQEAFLAALAQETPLGAVALHDASPELVPGGERGEAALAQLAERLAALDLSGRAAALLRQAMERAPAGESRAGLGLRLAEQRLSDRDAEGALAALADSAAPGLPPGLVARRSVAAAQAEARRGRVAVAAEALAALGPAGDEALANILAEARDFQGAAQALGRILAGEAPLDDGRQRAVLRQAAFLALAGDEPGLAALRQRFRGRLAPGALASAFDALTADPARGLAELPRMMRELNLFRAVPGFREPLRTAQGPAG